MKPFAWSHSALSDFKNCPLSFYEKRVAKSVKEAQTEPMLWGNKVHKYFENRQAKQEPLPADLSEHEDFMRKLEERPGPFWAEQKAALDLAQKPCGYFGQGVWWRGVLDYTKILDNENNTEKTAIIVDYKTGKVFSDFSQLDMSAIYTFIRHPEVALVNAQFYWTKTKDVTKKIYGRADIPMLWAKITPDLAQYVQAFKTNTWQPRQSGLCKAHCPVLSCQHNGRR